MTPRVTRRARDRFTNEWGVNFAVVANAGSGKTTAISERLAAIALSEGGAEILGRTAVVTYTKKAAAQIEQRARSVLLRRMAGGGGADAEPLAPPRPGLLWDDPQLLPPPGAPPREHARDPP